MDCLGNHFNFERSKTCVSPSTRLDKGPLEHAAEYREFWELSEMSSNSRRSMNVWKNVISEATLGSQQDGATWTVHRTHDWKGLDCIGWQHLQTQRVGRHEQRQHGQINRDIMHLVDQINDLERQGCIWPFFVLIRDLTMEHVLHVDICVNARHQWHASLH